MPKAIMIIAQENFRDEELLETKKVLEDGKVEVKVAAPKLEKTTGKLGAVVTPDLTIDKIELKDLDALIFVGGPGAADYFDDKVILKMAKDAYEKGKIVAAICIAPSILANAGILKGVRSTAFPSEEHNLREKEAEYTGNVVETSGKIITGRGPEAAKEFGQRIIEALK